MSLTFLVLAAVAAIGDWAAVARRYFRVEYLLKPLTLLFLIVAAATADLGPGQAWVVAALVCGLLGDLGLLVSLDGEADPPFVLGLAAFLIGHLFYIVAFARHGLHWLFAVAGLLVVAGAAGLVLMPVLRGVREHAGQELAVVVGGYSAVLGAMTVLAVSTGSPLTALGGVLFLASDTVLAYDRFVRMLRRGPVLCISASRALFAAASERADMALRTVLGDHGQTAALKSGEVQVAGAELAFESFKRMPDAYRIQARTAEFDICELAPTTYLIAREKSVPITALPIPQIHGDIASLGFRIGDFAYSPDVSDLPDEALPHLEGLDVWIVDALRYRPHPSHFSLREALDWIERLRPKRAILTHMHVDLDYRTLLSELPAGVEPASAARHGDDPRQSAVHARRRTAHPAACAGATARRSRPGPPQARVDPGRGIAR